MVVVVVVVAVRVKEEGRGGLDAAGQEIAKHTRYEVQECPDFRIEMKSTEELTPGKIPMA